MKWTFNHIHQVSLGLVLTLMEYRGETVLDTCLNYSFDRLFYILNKMGQSPDAIRQMIGAACIVFFILLNLKANHVNSSNKMSRVLSSPGMIKAGSDLEKWGGRLLRSIDLNKIQS
jgi:hypothetical protein